MARHVAVVGAGVIGAAVAWQLARSGARVSVIDAGPVSGAASGRSFGWINASFHLDPAHFRLRLAAMQAWGRAEAALQSGAVQWPGCLCWEEQGAAFDAQYEGLKTLGYPVDIINKSEFEVREPGVADAPERCLVFPGEGVVDCDAMARAMLAAAGARVISGCRVEAIETAGGAVRGLRLEAGRIAADAVVVAAGVGAAALVAPLGVVLPMLSRPGLLMRTRPVAPVIGHILVGPGQELRQDAQGRIVAPTAARHQNDPSESVDERPDALADIALARLRAMLPGVDLVWEEVMLAARPVPGDGRPVIGVAGGGAPEGLYLTVMHSGATLAALVGELAAGEVMGGAPAEILASYRPVRFQSARP